MPDYAGTAQVILFFILLIVDILIYGFQAALSVVDEREIERRQEEEQDRKAARINYYADARDRVDQLTSTAATLVHAIMGAVLFVPAIHKCVDLIGGTLKPNGVLADWLLKTVYRSGSEVSVLHIISAIVVALLFIYLVTSFGIMLPRRLAVRKPQKWTYRCVGFIHILDKIFTPLMALPNWTVKGMMFIFGGRGEEALTVLEQEIMDMVHEGNEQGVIEDNEAQMIHKIFEYGDKEAQDIMTNRSQIVAIDAEMTLEEALQFMLEGKNSRYPVYEENIDHIVGVLYLKDAMRFYNAGNARDVSVGLIEGLLRKAEYIPLTRYIDDLFETLQSKKLQMAIVVDEYGQTAGLVTMEDILEEIVGKIQDEYDEDEDFIEETSSDSYVMEGMTPLQDIEEQLDIVFDDTEFETLNGFIIGVMEHIPEPDEDFDYDYKGYNFKVLSIENMRVQSVLVTKLAEAPAEESESEEE